MLRYSFFILGLKRKNRKVKREKTKRYKKEYYGDKKEAIKWESGILEVSVYYYKIYE